MYNALAQHVQAFPDFVGDDAARIDNIMSRKAVADAKMDLIDAAVEAAEVSTPNDTVDHDLVNNYLLTLKNEQPEQFEIEKRLPFDELLVIAKA